MLLLIAFGTLKPLGGLVPHDQGNFAAQVEFAHSIWIVELTKFVTIGNAAALGFGLRRNRTSGTQN